MNLDDLKSNWQNQKAPEISMEEKSKELMTSLHDFDKKVKRQNWLVTLAFGITFPALITFYFLFPEFGPIYYITIAGVFLLMIVYLWIFWQRRILDDQQDVSQNSLQFIDGRIAQLEYNKKVTRVYMPIYGIILTTLLLLYTGEVGKLMDPFTLKICYAVTITYISLCMVFGMRRQYRKDKENIDPLLVELREMKKSWEEG